MSTWKTKTFLHMFDVWFEEKTRLVNRPVFQVYDYMQHFLPDTNFWYVVLSCKNYHVRFCDNICMKAYRQYLWINDNLKNLHMNRQVRNLIWSVTKNLSWSELSQINSSNVYFENKFCKKSWINLLQQKLSIP